MTPELASRVADWRAQLASGVLTEDQEKAIMAQAVQYLRQGRVSASVASEKARTKRTQVKVEVDANSLLDEMEDL